MKAWADRFLEWADKRNLVSVRAFVLYFTIWITWQAFAWAATFASTTDIKDGVQMGLVIAAVTAPVSALQAAVFSAYMKSK